VSLLVGSLFRCRAAFAIAAPSPSYFFSLLLLLPLTSSPFYHLPLFDLMSPCFPTHPNAIPPRVTPAVPLSSLPCSCMCCIHCVCGVKNVGISSHALSVSVYLTDTVDYRYHMYEYSLLYHEYYSLSHYTSPLLWYSLPYHACSWYQYPYIHYHTMSIHGINTHTFSAPHRYHRLSRAATASSATPKCAPSGTPPGEMWRPRMATAPP